MKCLKISIVACFFVLMILKPIIVQADELVTGTYQQDGITLQYSYQLSIIGYNMIGYTTPLVKVISYTGSNQLVTIPETITVTPPLSDIIIERRRRVGLDEPKFTLYVDEIDEAAFCNNTSINEIKLPPEVYIVKDRAFAGCTSLTSLTIGAGILQWGSDVLKDCNNLTNISISCNSIYKDGTKWRNTSFQNNKNITSVSFESGITEIGTNSFYGCENLKDLVIPTTVNKIGKGAFANTLWYQNQKDGFLYINSMLYSYKGSIPSPGKIEIPSKTTSIIDGAFTNLSSLKSIVLPIVSDMGVNLFTGCINLRDVSIVPGTGGNSFTDTVFRNNKNITSLSIGGGVTTIGNNTFSGCEKLAKVSLASSVSTLGDDVFYGCKSLTSLDLKEGVVSLGNSALEKCSGLKILTVSTSLKRHGAYVLRGCNALTEAIIKPSNSSYSSTWNSTLFNATSIKKVYLRNGIVGLGDKMFENCTSLKEVYLSNTLRTMGMSPFAGCTSLTSLTLPPSLISIASKGVNNDRLEVGDQVTLYYITTDGTKEWYTNSPGIVDVVSYNPYNRRCIIKATGIGVGSVVCYNTYWTWTTGWDDTINQYVPIQVKQIDQQVYPITVYRRPFEGSGLTVIYGAEGSYAQKYASIKGYTFCDWNYSSVWSYLAAGTKVSAKNKVLYYGGTKGNSSMISIAYPSKLKTAISKKQADVKLSYASSNTKVATVSKTGVIVAQAKGTTTITTKLTVDKKVYTFKTTITVKNAYISFVKIPSKVVHKKKYTYKVAAYGYDTKKMVWRTNKSSLMYVGTNKGKTSVKVIAKKKGTVYLIVGAKDRRGKTVSKKLKVLIK